MEANNVIRNSDILATSAVVKNTDNIIEIGFEDLSIINIDITEDQDLLSGDRGFDQLEGGDGVDIFPDGAGSDLFIVESERNSNWNVDFEVRVDHIGLANGITHDDLIIEGTISTFVSYQGVNAAILLNVNPAGITTDSFETF